MKNKIQSDMLGDSLGNMKKNNESLMRYFLKFLVSLTDILAETLDKILAEILKITLLKTLHIKQQNLDFANIHRY